MKILGDNNTCTGCGACENICPQNAIKISYNGEGFLYPIILEEKCIQCGKCKKICPTFHESKTKQEEPLCLVAKSKTLEPCSSSGGIFAVMAKYVLRQEGVVFGASYNKDFQVVHICIKDEKDLYRLQGSKYVQSRIGHTFRQAEQWLKMGKLALFTGTACQIAGLKSFLSNPYENLICMDIICHGVPAPRVWEKYLESFYAKKNIDKIDFRKEEKSGEKKFCIQFHNGKKYERVYPKDAYIWGFCYDLFLRKSCYDCNFKKMERDADITVGDAWGMEKYAKALFRKKDKVSVVIINTQKGERLLHEIIEDLEFQEVKAEWIRKNNKMLAESTLYNKDRDEFFKELKKYSFKYVIKKFYIKKYHMKKWKEAVLNYGKHK